MSFLREIKRACVALLALGALTGLLYPLAVHAAAALLFPGRAGGSLVVLDGEVRGSALVGQEFRGARWFHGRPSATSYSALPSGGTNLGTNHPELARAFAERAAALRAQGVTGPLPADLLTSSASGLDPHVSPAAARAQVARVAQARGLAEERVRALVEAHVEGRLLGVLGVPRVDVLALNLALEGMR